MKKEMKKPVLKFITDKKINSGVAGLLLYLSFCLSGFYMARGEWGYSIAGTLQGYGAALVSNAYFAFFTGGLLPFLLYEIITGFTFRLSRQRFGLLVDDLKYSLRFFYCAANLTIALFTLIYLISPLLTVYGEIFFPFVITTPFFALYIKFIFKHYIEKSRRGAVLMQLGGVYVIFYAFITVLQLFGTVLL